MAWRGVASHGMLCPHISPDSCRVTAAQPAVSTAAAVAGVCMRMLPGIDDAVECDGGGGKADAEPHHRLHLARERCRDGICAADALSGSVAGITR
eukprot:363973-Chlamydomonas_euryale.AAC.1